MNFISRSLVLAFARVMNYALALLSPLLLVRLLEISEYGRYRQFTVTAMFIGALAGFAIGSNLNYLIARSHERTSAHLTNACLLMFVAAVAAGLFVVAGHRLIVPDEIAPAWPLLALFVFLALNLDVPVSYWLAYGRSDQVMRYTLSVTVLRLAAVLGATVLFGDVMLTFVAMVWVEALRCLAVYVWLRRRDLLIFEWNGAELREQVRLMLPLGMGSSLYKLNENLGKLVVGNQLGAVPLAIYSTAAYQVPIVGIVQGALADVIFPDMVKRSRRDPMQGLRLWKRANVLIFAAICPTWLLLTYFAEPFIRLLFTDAYVAAAPYFQVFLLLMLRQTFQFSTPLRSVEDNNSFARANLLALIINVGLIFALMPKFGLWGPTLGLTVGQLWIPFYLGHRTLQRYRIGVSQLCEWRQLALTLGASLLALGALHVSQLSWPHSFGGLALGLTVFVGVYGLCARLFLREEYAYVMRELGRRGGAPA